MYARASSDGGASRNRRGFARQAEAVGLSVVTSSW